jgi:glycosyltransferase involved in cell wall biosynthesis
MREIVMVGPSLTSKGGVTSVIKVWLAAGLFDQWKITYLQTQVDGSKLAKIGAAFISFVRFLGLLLRSRVSILHAHISIGPSFYRKSIFVILTWLFMRPIIAHVHGGLDAVFWENCNALKRWFIRFVLAKSDRIIVLSSQWKENIIRILPSGRIECIENPVQIGTPNRVVDRTTKSLLYLGLIAKNKGLFDLLAALVIVKEQLPDVELICGGVGDMVSFAQKVDQLGLSKNVKTLGWVDGEAKWNLLMSSAVYVLPSYREGMPMGILEAMSFGMPIIATSVGGIPDMLTDGAEGKLVPPGDPNMLSEAILLLLRDSQLRAAMGNAAVRKVRSKFVPEKVLPKLCSLYADLGATPVNAKSFDLVNSK